MKVLHIETGRHLYGGALQVTYLLEGLRSLEDCNNILVCPKRSAISVRMKNRVDALYAIPIYGDIDFFLFFRLLAIIKREKPDLVHVHSRRGADIWGGLAAKVCRTMAILTRRVDNPERHTFFKLKYKLYSLVITISDGIKNVLLSEGMDKKSIEVIRSAVDTNQYRPKENGSDFRLKYGLAEDCYVIGVIAQLIPRKGHSVLMKIAPDITRKYPYVRFIFFGKGPIDEDLRKQSENLDLCEKIIFAGFVDNIEDILPFIDLVVHPAFMEGLGVSLIQASACGIPIIASRVGGIPEIVRDGENGLLVPANNPKALLDKITFLLEHPDTAKRLGKNGRKIAVELFSINRMVTDNYVVYKTLLGRD